MPDNLRASTMSNCHCGNDKSFSECCEPYIKGESPAPTAEALMRSRYSAYVVTDIDYLEKTLTRSERRTFDKKSAKEWSKNSSWIGLEIKDTKNGAETDTEGVVEFIASYQQAGKKYEHHERSLFRKNDDQWLYVNGEVLNGGPVESDTPAVARSAPCPCGSGKKYKRCCGA